jgi:hypothetical protein
MGVGSGSTDFDGLVDGAYEAAIIPDQWPRALADMAKLVDGAFASLVTFDGRASYVGPARPRRSNSSIASRKSRRPFPIVASHARVKRIRSVS